MPPVATRHFYRAKVAPPARRRPSVKMIIAQVFAGTGVVATEGEHGPEARLEFDKSPECGDRA